MQIILICVNDHLMSECRPRSTHARQSQSQSESSPSPIPSETLFAPGQRAVPIQPGGELRRLRQTRNSKLILTK
jgi:hemin uptake protein HemP